ncbi:alpha/beta fold hydrolase [Micromonospora sp. ATCC 39149]|uniref:Alpha/beta hydrolase n=1 Tax=Micromonospora carbonacea TaxID=47853 RepID=A0A7D5YE82_9ACTN|nr:alpha/beta hydrolase [Micromonospora sp. ATCC 39149]QLJ99537.1 alpha/beta hydrolase [Micromonospora carbonacea]
MASPLILVPGLLGTADLHYGPCLPLWADRSVTAVELPGHGADDPVPEKLSHTAVERVVAAAALGSEPSLLVGVSYLGSAVALRAAAELGDRIRGVVVSGYSFTAQDATLRRWLSGFIRLAERSPDTGRHFEKLHGPQWPHLLTLTLEELSSGRLRLPDRDHLGHLDVPVLLANGALLEAERIAVQPVAAAADVAVLPAAGHLVPKDSPRLFATLVDDFDARITTRRTTFHERRAAQHDGES